MFFDEDDSLAPDIFLNDDVTNEQRDPNPIYSSLQCRVCEYELRGLYASGRCPECGTPIHLSIRGDWLFLSQTRWLRTIRRGMIWIGVSAAIGAVGTLCCFNDPRQTYAILGTAAATIGAWQLTTRESDAVVSVDMLRRLIRSVSVACLALTIAQLCITSVGSPISLSIAIGNSAIAILWTVGELRYIQRLARRLPSERITRRATVLMYVLGSLQIVEGLFITLFLVVIILPALQLPANLSRLWMGVGGMIQLTNTIGHLFYLALLKRFAHRLKILITRRYSRRFASV